MKIHAQFTGGNIRVLKEEDSTVYLQNEIRDTMEDWFYWAFCVEGAEGRTVTFRFDKPWLGYFGPAVSHDLIDWHWLGAPDETVVSDTFTYTFGPEERRVYFAHDMLYHPAHFDSFCSLHGLTPQELCVSFRGRKVPYLRVGHGEETILLTARHHACESTGSYVLEGVVEELVRHPLPNLELVVVPFVDYDGVVDGDQGKSRAPHDHNRDYDPETEAIYSTVREIRKIAVEKPLRYAFDFHSPWHNGAQNDWVFVPQKHFDILKNVSRFQRMFELQITSNSLPFTPDGTYMPGEGWNVIGTHCFSSFMHTVAGAELAFTLETPYFKALECPFSAERAREMGRCFARALHAYQQRDVTISFTGDLLYQNPMNDLCKTEDGYDYMPLHKQVWGRLPDTDYLVGNLESPVAGSDIGGYTCERYCFNTPDSVLDALKKIGFDLLSLANNHAMDRGQEGILATLAACERAGIDHIGLYRTSEESQASFVRNIGGIRVGFVNATYGTNAFAHHRFLDADKKYMVSMTQPEETLPGSIHLLLDLDEIERKTHELYDGPVSPLVAPYLQRLKEEIQRTKAQSDYVVMLLHSGGQYNTVPDAYTKMLAQKIKEYGADIIVCNHPHIILPSTLEEDGYFTAYCLGNLMDMCPGAEMDCPVNPDFSVVLNLTLCKQPDGSIQQHLSFRLFQLIFDENRQAAPHSVDTFDQWVKHPSDAYRQQILQYANCFMPGKNYDMPQAEYVIC